MILSWKKETFSSISSVTQPCLTLCDPMNCSTPDLPVHHQLSEFTQTHIHWFADAIQSSHLLSSPSPAFNLSQHQDLFKWVNYLHQVAKVIPVIMYKCETWTIKKAEHWRIDAFKLWCWRRHLRVPWTIRQSNQSVLKKINPEYSLEGLILKLKLQYLGHLMLKSQSIGKDPGAGKEWTKVKGTNRGSDG